MYWFIIFFIVLSCSIVEIQQDNLNKKLDKIQQQIECNNDN